MTNLVREGLPTIRPEPLSIHFPEARFLDNFLLAAKPGDDRIGQHKGVCRDGCSEEASFKGASLWEHARSLLVNAGLPRAKAERGSVRLVRVGKIRQKHRRCLQSPG